MDMLGISVSEKIGRWGMDHFNVMVNSDRAMNAMS
jgi:hypothetical protein